MKLYIFIVFCMLIGCGIEDPKVDNRRTNIDPKNMQWVTVARSTIVVKVQPTIGLTTWTTTGTDNTQVVNTTLSPTATMTVSNTSFIIPTITSDLLSFGSLNVTNIRDNNLKVCGSGNQKCTAAAIRVYTTGQTGAGFWNSADAYSAPLNVAVGPSPTYVATGLNSTNAVYVEQIILAANKNVVNVSDFSPTPNILIQGDFTNAGSGSYATTINVEFVVGM